MLISPDTDDRLSRGSSTDDDLEDLRIDGYRIEFSKRVALLPVDLDQAPPPGHPDG